MQHTDNFRSTVSIRFLLRYTAPKVEHSVLYVRTTVNGVRAPEQSLNMKILKSDWDNGKQQIVSESPQAEIYNARLRQIRTAFDRALFQMTQIGETITARSLQRRALGEKQDQYSFKNAFDRFLSEKSITTKVSKATIQAYEKYHRNISQFLMKMGYKNLFLNDVNEQLMLKMLIAFKGHYSQDYAVKNVQFFRSVFTYAFAKGMVNKNPLTTIRLEKSGDYDTTHLTQEEVKAIAEFDFGKLDLPEESIRVLNEERDALIFTCYTGLHHSDYSKAAYELKQYNGRTWITGYRVKSQGGRKNKPYSIPLHPLALGIIEKYGGISKLPKRNNAKRNLVLKNIAAYTGVNVHLTTKVARKTLADYCLNTLRMRQEVVASILGHTSTRFVRHYAAINDQSIDEEMRFEV